MQTAETTQPSPTAPHAASTAELIHAELIKAGVRLVVTIPDSKTNSLYNLIAGDPRIIVNAAKTDYVAMARGAGIDSAFAYTDRDTFKREIGPIVRRKEFALVILETELGGEQYETYPADPIEQTYKFGRELERPRGISIFKYQP